MSVGGGKGGLSPLAQLKGRLSSLGYHYLTKNSEAILYTNTMGKPSLESYKQLKQLNSA